jgi:hypothetical protein
VPGKDTLMVTANADIIQTGKIPIEGDYITGTGTQLLSRNMDFTTGSTSKYTFFNLLKLGEKPYMPVQATDSIVGKEEVETPAGTFECYKVKNIVPGIIGYSYYTTDNRHIKVKTELIDPQSGKVSMTHILQKYE